MNIIKQAEQGAKVYAEKTDRVNAQWVAEDFMAGVKFILSLKKNPPAACTQDFLEKYLPNYYHRDDVAHVDDMDKFLSGEMDEAEQEEKGFKGASTSEMFKRYFESHMSLVFEAIMNYYQLTQG